MVLAGNKAKRLSSVNNSTKAIHHHHHHHQQQQRFQHIYSLDLFFLFFFLKANAWCFPLKICYCVCVLKHNALQLPFFFLFFFAISCDAKSFATAFLLFFTFASNAKSFAIAYVVFLLLILLVTNFGRTGKFVCVFFFYCCFRRVWPISDLLTWYAACFHAMYFRDKP